MSYDFSVQARPCDHLVSNERYVLDTVDLRTLRYQADTSLYTRAPINSSSELQVFISGVAVPMDHPRFGYSLVRDTTRTDMGDTFLKVVFNQQIRLVKSLIEVKYFTLRPYCLKCMTTGQTNDFKKSNSGGLIHLIGNQKLVQRCLKWVLTSTCSFYPSFTCPIKTYVGRKFGLAITDVDISQSVTNALQTMKQVQTAQATVQKVDSTEVLQAITGVSTQSDASNPTLIQVSIDITAAKGNGVGPINFNLRAAN